MVSDNLMEFYRITGNLSEDSKRAYLAGTIRMNKTMLKSSPFKEYAEGRIMGVVIALGVSQQTWNQVYRILGRG